MFFLTLFIGVSLVATGVAQAAGDTDNADTGGSLSDVHDVWESVWDFDLAAKLAAWKPSVYVDDEGEGFNLAHPLGKAGPALQLTSSMPDSVHRSLRAGGDTGVGSLRGDTDAYLFLQKRW